MLGTRPLFIAMIFASIQPGRAGAQAATAASPDSSLRALLAGVSADTRQSLRLTTSSTGRLQARSVHLQGDSVLVVRRRDERRVAVSEVDSLWVQRGTAVRPVAIVAAVPCAVYGALVGAFLATDPDSNGRPGRGPIGALIGGAAGALPCGFAGAGVGYLIKRWRLKFARPRVGAFGSADGGIEDTTRGEATLVFDTFLSLRRPCGALLSWYS